MQAPASAIVCHLGVHGKKRSAPTGARGPPGQGAPPAAKVAKEGLN